MTLQRASALLCAGLALALLNACDGVPGSERSINAGGGTSSSVEWTGAWAAAPYGPYPSGPLSALPLPVDPLALTTLSLFPDRQSHDQSFRMIVHPTIGGSRLRIRLSNLMGDRPLVFSTVQVARRLAGPALVPGTVTPVNFGGADRVEIAMGAEAISDAVPLAFARGDDLAISFHVAGDSGPLTWHAVSFSLNFVGPPGLDVTADPTGGAFAAQPTVGWFFVSGVDVPANEALGSIVTLGDSITDGAYEVPETNTRWPDFLSQRLAAQGIVMGVLNQGINSNTVTAAAYSETWQGPPAELRFDRDVLQRSGVRSIVLFEGTNDLTAGIKADAIYAGLRGLVDRAHAAGLCVVLGTIMPRDDLIFGWDRATMESERQALNAMIRATPVEGIADFDAAMGSRLDPTRPNPVYYSPDLLHPTSLGFSVMANAVPLEALVPPPAGTCAR